MKPTTQKQAETTAKHTPGGYVIIEQVDEVHGAVEYTTDEIIAKGFGTRATAQVYADMLTALEAVDERQFRIDDGGYYCISLPPKTMDAIRVAIAKAKGEK